MKSAAICRAAITRPPRWSATPIGPTKWPSPRPKPLAVLPSGAKSSDPYRLTPEELFALGKHHFQRGDWKAAGKRLTDLLENWNLGAETYHQTVRMLLDVHLELGPPAQVVRYFEIVKEKWPDEEIPFAKIVKVGAAYHDMGEYERSYLVFRATVEGSFLRDSGVAGFLEEQGQFLRSVDVFSRMLREYPPEGYIAEATYALAQHVYAKAPEAAADAEPVAPRPISGARAAWAAGCSGWRRIHSPSPSAGPPATSNRVAPAPKSRPASRSALATELRRSKFNRVDLVRRAWRMLESFLTEYPDDPAADQAAFAAATALLDLRAYKDAAAACNRYAKRYPKSDLLDSFWYVVGYCHFARGQHEAALEMCRKVAEATRIDPDTGRQEPSRNKWQAVYILGQVYHSLGKAADAIREYRRVEDQFVDAKQSIAYFLRKAIELPEVVDAQAGRAGRGGTEVPQRRRLRPEGLPHRPDEVQPLEAEPGRHHADQSGRHPPAPPSGDRPGRRQGLSRPDAQTDAPLEGRGRLSGRLPRRQSLRQRHGAGHSAGGRGAGRRRLGPRPHHREEPHGREISSRRPREGDRQRQRGFRLRPDRSAGRVRGRRHPRRRHGDRPGRPLALCLLSRQGSRRRTGQRRRRATRAARGCPRPTAPPSACIADSEAREKIEAALNEPTQLEFVETPLTDVIDYLKDQHKIEIQLDKRALSDVGIGTDTPVTKNLEGSA